MTDVLTEKGANEGKLFAKINGVHYDVPGYLLTDLEKVAPGDEIGYKEYNNILTKIWKKRKTEKQMYITVPPNGNGKNQKLIVMQHNFTVVTDLFIASHPLENLDFATSLTEIYTKTKEITEDMMQDCEVA